MEKHLLETFCKDWSNLKGVDYKRTKSNLICKIKEYNKSGKKSDILFSFTIFKKYYKIDEPEPEIENNYNIEDKIYYINYPNWEEYIQSQDTTGLNDMNRHYFEKEMKEKYDIEYPFKNKYVKRQFFFDELEKKDSEIDRLEDLLIKHNIKYNEEE